MGSWIEIEVESIYLNWQRRGIGSILLGSLMAAIRDLGGSHMIAGMHSNWHASIHMHTKLGFRIQRRLSQCNLLNIFPTPPEAV